MRSPSPQASDIRSIVREAQELRAAAVAQVFARLRDAFARRRPLGRHAH